MPQRCEAFDLEDRTVKIFISHICRRSSLELKALDFDGILQRLLLVSAFTLTIYLDYNHVSVVPSTYEISARAVATYWPLEITLPTSLAMNHTN